MVSPAEGFIISRNITPGQHFERSMEFYRIADLSKVWIVADIFGTEAQDFRPGAIARVTLHGYREDFHGSGEQRASSSGPCNADSEASPRGGQSCLRSPSGYVCGC